ncbi:MAG: response regulator transcription factor [Chloroflexi bacterium]|nr:response regulator transcription factor [Chloroflexota bacterium]MCL5107511.1 response regulator transcription factor [Chloroflexota bacterium]
MHWQPGGLLLADADVVYRQRLAHRLAESGFACREVGDGRRLLAELERSTTQLVVLDVELPLLGGLELCEQVRRRCSAPMMVLTELNEPATRLRVLELYADDYVLKKTDLAEVAARVRCLFRRSQPPALLGSQVYVDGCLSLNLDCRLAHTPAGSHRLTRTEARLLRLLLENAGRTLPSSLLLERLWGDGGHASGSLWEYVRRVRRKIGDDAEKPRYLVNEPGLGYSFRRPAARQDAHAVERQS